MSIYFRVVPGKGHQQIVQLLLDSKCNIDQYDFRDTALIAACEQGHLEVVKLLFGKLPHLQMHHYNKHPMVIALEKVNFDLVILTLVELNKHKVMVNSNIIALCDELTKKNVKGLLGTNVFFHVAQNLQDGSEILRQLLEISSLKEFMLNDKNRNALAKACQVRLKII